MTDDFNIARMTKKAKPLNRERRRERKRERESERGTKLCDRRIIKFLNFYDNWNTFRRANHPTRGPRSNLPREFQQLKGPFSSSLSVFRRQHFVRKRAVRVLHRGNSAQSAFIARPRGTSSQFRPFRTFRSDPIPLLPFLSPSLPLLFFSLDRPKLHMLVYDRAIRITDRSSFS